MSVPSVKEQRLALQRQRVELNKSLNAIAYPNTLPIEVLSYIFALHSAMVMKVDGASQKKRSAERIRVAHICRHWRAVAVNSAELWSNLLFTSAEIVPLMVRRSKAAPLTIAMRQVDTRLNVPLRDILSSQAHRLRSVEVTQITDPEFVSLLTVPVPSLEKLILKFTSQHTHPNPRIPGLPDHLLHNNPPVLKHLEIRDFSIPNFETLPLVPLLTHLHLGSRCCSMPMKPSAETLLKTLQRLPHLEKLSLTRYLPTGVYPSRTDDNPIELPSLRSVSVSGSVDSLHNILKAVRIPYASLEIVFTDPIERIEVVEAFLPTLAKARKVTSEGLPLQALTIKNVWPEDDGMVYDFCFHDEDPKFCPRITVVVTRPILIRPAFFMGAFATSFMDLSRLKSLHLESRWSGHVKREEWEIFGLLPNLSTITFSCNADIEEFVHILNQASTVESVGVTQPHARAFPLFPALCSLSIEGTDLIRGSSYRAILVSALNKRTSPHRIHTLKVTYNDEDFSQKDVDFLRTSVPGLQVEWEQDEELSERDTDDEWDTGESEEEE